MTMRLIDEIEAAAKRCTIIDDDEEALLAHALVASPYWPRIKAALLAGDLMAHRIRNDYEPGHPAWAEMENFRAAAGEGT